MAVFIYLQPKGNADEAHQTGLFIMLNCPDSHNFGLGVVQFRGLRGL